MSSGEQKASDKRPLGPPAVRLIPASDAQRFFAAARAISARETGPDETGRIVGAPRTAAL